VAQSTVQRRLFSHVVLTVGTVKSAAPQEEAPASGNQPETALNAPRPRRHTDKARGPPGQHSSLTKLCTCAAAAAKAVVAFPAPMTRS